MSVTFVVKPGILRTDYALFMAGKPLCVWSVEQAGRSLNFNVIKNNVVVVSKRFLSQEYSAIYTKMAEETDKQLAESSSQVDEIKLKVSVPGTYFQADHTVDKEFMQQLRAKRAVAPTITAALVRELTLLQDNFPKVTIRAVSDTKFFTTIPTHLRTYSLPETLVKEHDIQRFGYDGIVTAGVPQRVAALLGYEAKRIVVCNVSESVSVSAIQNHHCVDTSGGYAVGTGLSSGSVGADIDAGAVLALQSMSSMRASDAFVVLQTRCGFCGSDGAHTLAEIFAHSKCGDALAQVVMNRFVSNIQKQIGAMATSLSGMDVLAFTGEIALRSSDLRSALLNSLGHLGVKLSNDRNDCPTRTDCMINTKSSSTKIALITADELSEMAQYKPTFNAAVSK